MSNNINFHHFDNIVVYDPKTEVEKIKTKNRNKFLNLIYTLNTKSQLDSDNFTQMPLELILIIYKYHQKLVQNELSPHQPSGVINWERVDKAKLVMTLNGRVIN